MLSQAWRWRIVRTAYFWGMMLLVLAGLLFYRQGWQGRELASRALRQRSYAYNLAPERGRILDRNGLLLTGEGQQVSAIVFPALVGDKPAAADAVARVLTMEREAVLTKLLRQKLPFRLKTGLSPRETWELTEIGLGGVLAVTEKVRYGPAALASHTLGYINSADNCGVAGIEKAYNDVLCTGGGETVTALVDANQNLIPQGGYRRQAAEAAAGDVQLTLDRRIQAIVETVMDDQLAKGAVVVLRPGSGEILAIASRPDFAPGDVGAYLAGSEAALLNRAVQGYPPGSIFKLVIAAALLEEHLVREDEVFFCPGQIKIGSRTILCHQWEKCGHGTLTLAEAVAQSCNVALIEAGQRLSLSQINDYARRFGFGARLEFGLPEEAGGGLETRTTVYAGDIANLCIGQGALLATPVQVAQMLAVIANGGVKVPLRLVSDPAAPGPAGTGSEAVLTPATAQRLQARDEFVVAGGTGRAAQVAGLTVAGKTGSAETGRYREDGEAIIQAWFAGYVPAAAPELVIVVLAEDGESGSSSAAPVFRAIVETIYRQ